MDNEKIIEYIKSAENYIKKYNLDILKGTRQHPEKAARNAEEAAQQKIFWLTYEFLTDIEQAAIDYKNRMEKL